MAASGHAEGAVFLDDSISLKGARLFFFFLLPPPPCLHNWLVEFNLDSSHSPPCTCGLLFTAFERLIEQQLTSLRASVHCPGGREAENTLALLPGA